MLLIYGIPNCDTVRKTLRYLENRAMEFRFIDLRNPGIGKAKLEQWCKKADWETLLNRRSNSFRGLPEADKTGLNQERAVELMYKNPTLIKRPVIELGSRLIIGYPEAGLQLPHSNGL